jgi:hypothetical protein
MYINNTDIIKRRILKMKMHKNILVLLCVMLSMIGISYAYTTSPMCTYASPVQDSTDWNPMSNTTYNDVVLGGDVTFGTLINVTPRLNTTITKCESFTALNKSTNTLYYYNRVVILNVTNSTGTVVGVGNYTLANNTAGRYNITWVFDNASYAIFNNTALRVCYNKTLTKNVDNLVSPTTICNGCTLLESRGGSNFGVTFGTRLTTPDLITGYAAEWTTVTRTCSTRDSCAATKTTIFAGFGILALFAIVGAGFLIVNIFNGPGGADMGTMMAVAISIVGLAIVLFMGYVVTGIIANVVCTV